ncbi:hypothetical protein FDH01_gp177 [Acinetobacter phage vB_AbaM_ME3]|uniref:Uncharacterized protein n=1 Tax=Acinetobacter phage vB_AbaM_ME3 TaxID=1837876 RepID=A0A172Q0T4_9CAUD|nr:hypothetical protein FDH01_gp177 [Acinetobacter phage vB_AbaM_ME3]AND75445.1 hypothetical protein ME3_284 [Acinetobacter phage vB_AbaM_ME3]
MSNFINFQKAIYQQIRTLTAAGLVLVRVDINPDVLWETYLSAFPEGTNPMLKERREYDCNNCKSFIRRMGGVVAIDPRTFKKTSIWNVEVEGYYQAVANALNKFVLDTPIAAVYRSETAIIGSATTKDLVRNVSWNHFYAEVPKSLVVSVNDFSSVVGEYNNSYQVIQRGLKEFSLDAAETVLELIDGNSIYRGNEFRSQVKAFVDLKKKYEAVPEANKEAFIWHTVATEHFNARFRNTVIGTLVEDISSGIDLDTAVSKFESKVAPTNYKRTSAVITPRMISEAQEVVKSLGLEDDLQRRFAKETDINVSEVLFSANAKKALNVFDDLTQEASSKFDPKILTKAIAIGIKDFLANVLPTSNKVELLVTNKLKPNFVSLIAPVQPRTSLLRWDNGFSWAYNGDITDSIRETVKKFGGSVEGDLRVSLSWFNADDLDLSIQEPTGQRIWYRNKHSSNGGTLDLDMNGLDKHSDTEPVENIIYPDRRRMTKGVYRVIVNNYSKRSNTNVGFVLQVEADGVVQNFTYEKAFNQNETMLDIEFDGTGFTVKKVCQLLESSDGPGQEIWGINTNTFVPVSLVMNSPNHWGDQAEGNKHYMFMLEGCKNPETPRSFFNEFLRPELTKHRKVFEVLGSKLRVAPSEEQLSGVGFNDSTNNEFVVRVSGKTQRVYQVSI